MWNQPSSDDTATAAATTRMGVRLALAAAGMMLANVLSWAGVALITLVSGCGGGAAADQPQLPVIPATLSQDAPTSPSFLPSNWQKLAIDAANAAVNACAQANTLNPAGCPQHAATDG